MLKFLLHWAHYSFNSSLSMFLPFLKKPFTNKKIAREDFLALLDGSLTRMAG